MNPNDFPISDRRTTILVAGLDLSFRSVSIHDRTPTGAQISAAAGFAPNQEPTVLQLLPDGGFEDLRPDEVIKFEGGDKFIIVETDRAFRLTIDGRRVDWPVARISGEIVRTLGKVPEGKDIYVEQQDTADRILLDSDVVDLSNAGIESFYSRQANYFFFIDGHKVNNSQARLSGMAIKQLGHQVDSTIDISHELVLESGHDPDRPIGDDESVDLAHGQGPKHFSTRPRTNFGGF